ncbi:MAG TPA: site-2 protease family protein [Anaerolineae bacterium]|nr:site-2 protease family protein [Anaerolineae bacterium]
MLFLQLGMQMIYLIVGLLIAISVHECAHAWMANKLGDPTAKEAGRLSLNPFAHLDPWGTLMLLVIGLGWGKPVPVDARRLRYGPQKGMALVGLAGPAANFITASIVAIPLRLHLVPFGRRYIFDLIPISFGEILSWVVWLCLALGLFNLIPFTPLDGSRIFAAFLPARWFYILARYERYALILFFVLILIERFTPFGILSRIIFPPIEFLWWQLVNMAPPFFF